MSVYAEKVQSLVDHDSRRLPDNAVQKTGLTLVKKLSGSCNTVYKVQYDKPLRILQESSSLVTPLHQITQPKAAFYKEITDSYNSLLCKFVAATRVSLATVIDPARLPEEHLVFNDSNELVGSLSDTLEGYAETQFQMSGDRSGIKPTLPDLVKNDVMSDFLAMYLRSDPDRHPKNHCLVGMIDFDETFFDITNIIKGPSLSTLFIDNDPDEMSEIIESDLETFPNVRPIKRHWCTHASTNHNTSKRNLAEANFVLLKDDPKAISQKFQHLLREVLAFNPQMLKARLEEELGDLPLGLDECNHETKRKVKEALIAKFGKALFYKQVAIESADSSAPKFEWVERSFADFFVEYSKRRYEQLYELLKKFTSFKQYLFEHPETFIQVREWFVQQNTNLNSNPYDSNPCQFDIEFIDRQYLQFWRDIFIKDVVKGLTPFMRLLMQTEKAIQKAQASDEIMGEFESESFVMVEKKGMSSEVHEDLGASLIYAQEALPEVNKSKSVREETPLERDYKKLLNIYEQMREALLRYCALSASDESQLIGRKSNADFVASCKELLRELQLDDNLFKTRPELSHTLLQTIDQFQRVLKELDYLEHERIGRCKMVPRTTSSLLSDSISFAWGAVVVRDPLESSNLSLDKQSLQNAFKTYVEQYLSPEQMKALARLAIADYKPMGSDSVFGYFNPRAYTSTRSKDLEGLLRYKYDDAKELYFKLTTSKEDAGWDSSSFNTKLVKRIAEHMAKFYKQDLNFKTKFPTSSDLFASILKESFDWTSKDNIAVFQDAYPETTSKPAYTY